MKLSASVSAIVFALVAVSLIHATPTLRITDGVTTVTITDNNPDDLSSANGFINYQAPVGLFAGWTVIVSSGATKPLIGSSTSPELDLTWNIVRTGPGAGNLTVLFSENGFNLAGVASAANSSGGTLGGAANTAQVRTYYDGGNTELATTTLLTTHTFTGPGGFSANDFGNAPADPSIAFTIRLDLLQDPGQLTSGDIHLRLSVPEGGSMVTFLGTALLALGYFAARRKQRSH